MSNQQLGRELALRIGLAARTLPETEPARLMRVLVDALGMPLSAEKLWRVTVKDLRRGNDGDLNAIDGDSLKRAAALLRGEEPVGGQDPLLPEPQPYRDGEMENSIRVAVASNSGEEMDGHFGTCARFLIYQVSPDGSRLIDIRSAIGPEARDDKNAYRANLIADCQLLYVVSIGGPAAARVVRADVHPVKRPQPVAARQLIEQTREMLAGHPPPWLARVMGVDAEGRVRFLRDQEQEEDGQEQGQEGEMAP